MRSPVFVDSPILIAARNGSAPQAQAAAQRWMLQLWQSQTGRVSQRVLDEFYVQATEEMTPGMPPAAARAEVRDLETWDPVVIDPALREAAWGVADAHDLSYAEGLLVASAETTSCGYLLTDRFEHGRRLASLEVVNPFHDLHRTTYLNEPGGEVVPFQGVTS